MAIKYLSKRARTVLVPDAGLGQTGTYQTDRGYNYTAIDLKALTDREYRMLKEKGMKKVGGTLQKRFRGQRYNWAGKHRKPGQDYY